VTHCGQLKDHVLSGSGLTTAAESGKLIDQGAVAMGTSYTDNTLADNPPGGKEHVVATETASTLPSDRWRARSKSK
jgi:hypothetical protein